MPGPVPKRSTERRRRNKSNDVDSVAFIGVVEQPPADESWHPIAFGWYRSLAESGQAQFYEPSDWQVARYVADAMSRNLTAGRFSAQLFASVMSAMSDLLTTEGARRRVRLEIDRAPSEPEAPVARIDEYRAQLSGR